MNQLIKPTHLNIGDTIGVISPSAPMAGLVKRRAEQGINMLKTLGFNVRIGHNAYKVSKYTAGSALERAADINDFFKDREIKAIFSFIGGNHSNQLLNYLNFDLIRKNPKIIMGYSDVTVLLMAIYSRLHMVTFYGPAIMTQFAEHPKLNSYTKEYFEKTLVKTDPVGNIKPSSKWTDEVLDWFSGEDTKKSRKMRINHGWKWLKGGNTNGIILGGCFSSLMHLRGTPFWPNFKDTILFLESSENEADFKKGDSLANIDSYLADMELSGVFKQIKGLVIGRPFRYSQEENSLFEKIIIDRLSNYHFPILSQVDIGHTDPMITIPIGTKVALDSKKNSFELLETGVI